MLRYLHLFCIGFLYLHQIAVVNSLNTIHENVQSLQSNSVIESDLLQLIKEHESSAILKSLAYRALGKEDITTPESKAKQRDALVQLGNIYFYGNTSVSDSSLDVNGTRAMLYYSKAADLGDPTGQFHLGVAYSYGFWGFPQDDAIAMVMYYFASIGDHVGAIMVLGAKHMLGINAPVNCETSVRYYEAAANHAMQLRQANESHPVIYDLPYHRLSNYVEAEHKKNLPDDSAIVDYYQFSADKGDPDAMMSLATLHFYGARGVQQDLHAAAKLFHKAYDLGASNSAYQLGRIYSYGIGVEQNNMTAIKYFKEAVGDGSSSAQNELAQMHLQGKGVSQDSKEALSLFKLAAKAGSMEAFYNLGVLHMQGLRDSSTDKEKQYKSDESTPEYEVAHGYFKVAAHQGHILSMHKLAHMSLHGIGTIRSCKSSLENFKLVAERGEWDRLVVRAFKEFRAKKYHAALYKYAVLAQMGYEIAQHNAAFMLDRGYAPIDTLAQFGSQSTKTEVAHLPLRASLMLYKAAAMQGNVDANLKLGDFYYYGKGDYEVDYNKAIAHYSVASKRMNAQAMFNLGIMYEHGIGVTQDFTLAKRFFDKSIAAHSDAKVPVKLALWKMHWHLHLMRWKKWWYGEDSDLDVIFEEDTVTLEDSSITLDGNTKTKSIWENLVEYFQSIVNKEYSNEKKDVEENLASITKIGRDEVLILILALAFAVLLYVRSQRL